MMRTSMSTARSSCAARPVASLGFASAADRRSMRKAMVHMAYSTPAQFSSFYGGKMLLPECYVRRGKQMLNNMLKKPAQMSFMGVGAPEALLVGVVALVVFGPKGLADAAKSLGQALRTFQPTIKEVVEVSQELKGTLEKELGLDELRQAARPVSKLPETLQPINDDQARAVDPDIEAKRAEAAKLAWGAAAAPEASTAASSAASASPAPAPVAAEASMAAAPSAPVAATPVAAAPSKGDLSTMSMEELEAELARRRGSGVGKA